MRLGAVDAPEKVAVASLVGGGQQDPSTRSLARLLLLLMPPNGDSGAALQTAIIAALKTPASAPPHLLGLTQ